MRPSGSQDASKVKGNKKFKVWNQNQQVSMHVYEDLSLEEALNVAHEAYNSSNLQSWEHEFENPLLPLVVKKALA